MNNATPPKCPFHPDEKKSSAPLPKRGWPPGPPSGVTGWHLIKKLARDPLVMLDKWHREHGDVIHLRVWPEHQISVADPDLVRDLLVNHHDALIRWEHGIELFSKVHGQSVLTSEGQSWQEKRRVLQPNFHRQASQSFVPEIAAAVTKSLAGWSGKEARFPIESALVSLTMDVILRMMVSSEIGDEARLLETTLEALRTATNKELYRLANLPDWLPWKAAKRKGRARLHAFIEGHVQERLRLAEEAWPDDLLSRLLRLHRSEPAAWPLRAVHDECMTTFLAGHSTVAETLTWWAWCMAANPPAQAAARAEVREILQGKAPSAEQLGSLGFLTRTIEETMRLYPVAPFLFARRLTAPITLGSWTLPERAMVAIPVHVIHHDPRWYPEPQAFRPERFGPEAPPIPRGAFLPFGTGPRVCLGQNLAMIEMTVVAAMILQRFDLSVPEGMAPPKPMVAVTMRPDSPLHLHVAERFHEKIYESADLGGDMLA